jgi:asparagine synthase (glutamine-hydrolysing)
MCGIAGILNLKEAAPIDEHLLCRMMSAIRYRGPDESGIYIDPQAGLGHVRLSIIGLAGGGQPISNEDNSLWIVYNGEAFNYIELRGDLLKRGHTFKTDTDTEVILHLYEDLGPSCLEKINGQFALAIWNSREKELFLARDRVGIRPLYYCRTEDKIFFASEIKAIFANPDVERAINLESLCQVFTFWTTISPRTIFKDIYELPPGHFMMIRNGEIHQEPFWSIPHYNPEEQCWQTFEEAREELQSLLKDAVRIRLRADVPVGAYLSGGLDSSIITALISRNFNNCLKTFSISFQDDDFDESFCQRILVDDIGTDHRQTLATNSGIRDHFADVVWHSETPLLRTAPVPLFLLSRLVRKNNLKVVLTGEGADEVFGGYNIFKEAKIRAFWGKHPESNLRPLLLEKLYPYIFKNPTRGKAFLYKFYEVKPSEVEDPFFSHKIRWKNTGKNVLFFSDNVLSDLTDFQPLDEIGRNLPSGFSGRDVLSKAQLLEMDIFLSNYLLSSQGDRVAMAHSLEIRLPFLDYRVIDFAFRMPTRWKVNGLNEKYILKHSAKGLIPDAIRERPKQPYRAPIREVFFSNSQNEFLNEILTEASLKKAGLFNPKKVHLLLSKFRKAGAAMTSEVQNMGVVGILSTQLLHHQFIENFPWKPIDPLVPDKIIRNFSLI